MEFQYLYEIYGVHKENNISAGNKYIHENDQKLNAREELQFINAVGKTRYFPG
jgi:hypothetical protein